MPPIVTGGFFHLFPLALVLLPALAAAGLLLVRRLPPDSRGREWGGRLLLLFASLGLLFLAGEGWFYLAVDTTDAGMATLSSKRWYRRHVAVNELGVRGEPLPPPDRRSPGEVRILVLGDSLTFGQGIDDHRRRYPELLEEGLRAQGHDAAVINVSWPGWDTADELRALERLEESGFCYDILVLGYCLNDIVRMPGVAVPSRVSPLASRPFLSWAADRSFFISWILLRTAWAADPAAGSEDVPLVEAYREAEIWMRLSARFGALAERRRDRGAEVLLLILPYVQRPWQDYPFGETHGDLALLGERLGFRVVDLLEGYRTHPVADLVVSRQDTHLNELAHRLAAQRLLTEVLPLRESVLARRSPPPERDGALPALGAPAGAH
jgi:lysophospholipase L1-like esterase